MGEYKSLRAITDDPRIKVPAEEYERIRKAKNYYQDNLSQVKYYAMGNEHKRKLNSINVTKMASRRLASLIFNEQCSIKVDDSQLQDILDTILKRENFYTTFETELEKWIALGSGGIRPYVEDDKVKLSYADADDVYPLNSNTTKVDEIALSRRIRKIENNEAVYYTLLEFHQWGSSKEVDDQGNVYRPYTITNELYRSGDSNSIGELVPLNSIDEYADLQPQSTFQHLEKPLFAFYRNAGANNKSLASPLGLGLCDNYWHTVDDINATHDGFAWDVKTGYRRITIPKTWVRRQTQINGKSIPEGSQMYWDPKDAVFVPINACNDDSSSFKDLAIQIRTEQYTASMDFFLHEFENEVGLSQGTFTTSPTGVQTATEVVTNNSMTYQTRSSYLTQVEKMIDQLVYAIAELLQTPDVWSDRQARWSGDIDKLTITPDFNDGVFVDQEAQRQSDLQAVQAGILPKKQFLMRNYNLDENTADQWLSEIQDEQSPEPPEQEMSMFPSEGGVASDRSRDNASPDDGESK
ncbi:phage portal protein [Lactobacillus crispatus]|uniref:phage portal protein n=1 Tax=Lactobacillus crispatus TaxID=47770 RepID=UPI00336A4F9E